MSKLIELTDLCGGELVGNGEHEIVDVCSVDKFCINKIAHVNSNIAAKLIFKENDQAYLVKPKHSSLISLGIVHDNPIQAFRLILNHFHPYALGDGLDSTCIINKNSKLGSNVSVGSFSIVRENSFLSNNVLIGSHSSIHENVILGENSRIGDHVVINEGTRIGSNCVISDGAVIGGPGFGFSFEGGNWKPMPQIGTVIVGDNVHIGANSCIDRGAINDTVIGDNVIIDNLVHIAHNVHVGEGTAMAACVGIAGSTSIGKNCMLAGQVGVVGHINIADGVQIHAGAMVLKSINEPGSYSGSFNALQATKWNRITIYVQKLESIFKKRKKL